MPNVSRPHVPGAARAAEHDALHDRAADNIRFIRDTMARAGAFTNVSGAGVIGAGVVGSLAALVSSAAPLRENPATWVSVWLVAALIAGGVSSVAIRRKALRTGQSLSAGPARRFALAFTPALVAGAVLTVAFLLRGLETLLPGTWLTLYGAAVTAGGALSIRLVPVMGAAFLVLGAGCFAVQSDVQLIFLGAGFGGLHLLFGFFIARRHGG